MRWAVLTYAVCAVLAFTVASCTRPILPLVFVAPVPKFVIPASVPGWWSMCVEHPAMNWERPGEPKIAGWTTCTGTVDQLRDRVNQIRAAGVP